MAVMSTNRRRPGRRIGMRIWLAAAFAAVTLITAGSVYLFINDSSGRSLRAQASDFAVGRTAGLADAIEAAEPGEISEIFADAQNGTFSAVLLNRRGKPIFDGEALLDPAGVPSAGSAIQSALRGRRFSRQFGDNVTVAAAPVFAEARIRGALLSRSTPPRVLQAAIDELRADSLRALAIAIAIGVAIGFIVASLITIRIRRLAHGAERMASGSFNARIGVSGRDEIADLAHSLEALRGSLRETFDLLATERDRLSATLDGLTEAVIVVGQDGQVRFSNPAAREMISKGFPDPALTPVLRRTALSGASDSPSLKIGERTYAAQGRRLPAEQAVLMVVRDRTAEVQRDQAEREFVSNAAHELRNPLAGISGMVEVLRDGAADDPDARDRFLARLADDAERMTRLTEALLTLAKVEAREERGLIKVVDVSMAAREAAAFVHSPAGMGVSCEIEPDLVAEGDPVLLRQVLIGLLTNAIRHTPGSGTVTLRAFRGEEHAVIIEVVDTGRGIPPEDQDRVFERFYRGEDAREEEGFGLGLAIAKRMVNVMGGEIGLRSRPGAGATFWIRLKAARPSLTPVA